MTIVKVGQSNHLTVVRDSNVGYFFDGGEDGEILMPVRHQPDNELNVDDELDVFIFHDSEGRLTATVNFPEAQVGEVIFLEVIDTHRIGAFLEWGLTKDLLVPAYEQSVEMEIGKSYIVRILLDNSGRIKGSSYLNTIKECNEETFEFKQQVNALITEHTELGWKAIINHTHWGVIYHNEAFKKLSVGETVKAYVKNIREDDKIDISLLPQGFNRNYVSGLGKQILEKIDSHNGFLPLNDKSTPDEIREMFEVSKKSFKKATGGLYRDRLITIEKDGLRRSENKS